jgi:hypothetical protein
MERRDGNVLVIRAIPNDFELAKESCGRQKDQQQHDSQETIFFVHFIFPLCDVEALYHKVGWFYLSTNIYISFPSFWFIIPYPDEKSNNLFDFQEKILNLSLVRLHAARVTKQR